MPSHTALAASPVITFTCFRYEGVRNKVWAMSQMQLALPSLQRVDGLQFFKMLGTGQQFHYFPNFSVYGMLAVWEDLTHAQRFFRDSPAFRPFAARSQEWWTLYLKNYQTHGYWSGQQPFVPTAKAPPADQPIAVLTRATLNLARLRSFWGQAVRINRQFAEHTDCWLSLGIGEWPVVQQATFSLWKDADSMKRFAYRSPLHQQAIRRTRQHAWFTEDLFARFIPIGSEGSWYGKNPLEG